MNHIHRCVIFSQIFGVRQTVSKVQFLPAPSARRSIAVAATLMCLSVAPAWAAGGNGGAGGSATDMASPGGLGATVGDGADGAPGSLASGQGGGGGGGGAASRTGILGGAGGRGGAGSSEIEPGTGLPYIGVGTDGGRAGNAGAMRGGDIAADIVGGNGQNAFLGPRQSYSVAGGGGGGGEGGVGLIVPAASSAHVLVGVQIFGGSGGSGGWGESSRTGIDTAGSGGTGGAGGIGVYMSSGSTLTNDGSIYGGLGGRAGPVGVSVSEKVSPTQGGDGIGGIGVVANGGLIDNGGTIEAGGQYFGPITSAVFFNSGDTMLRLRAGTVITGALEVGPNASATIQAATNGLKLDGGLILDGPATVNTDGFNLEVNSTISGAASLTKSGAGELLLSSSNTYTGPTIIAGGILQAGAANAFGNTASMTVAAGGTLDLNGYSESVAQLAGAGIVRFGAANGQTPAGGPEFRVGSNGVDSTFNGQVVGAGSFTKVGPGTLSVAGAWSHIGSTRVDAGTLRATAAGVYSPTALHVVAPGATLDTGGFDQTIAGLTNSGTVSLLGSNVGSTLTVTGPYVGNGGVLRVRTVLGDSSSASDRLVLNGPSATATGTTTIQVTSLGGLGAFTVGNGIEIVRALNGATTTAQSTKSAFSLNGGHVDAGAFEYRLYAADANGAGESWYLRSAIPSNTVTPGGTSAGSGGSASGSSGSGSGSGSDSAFGSGLGLIFGTGLGSNFGGASVPTYRVEVPLLAALPEQLREANFSMLGSLRQRMGDDRMDEAPGTSAHERRAWGRLITAQRTMDQGGTVAPRSEGRLTGFQAGTDLWASSNWNAGLFVGQLDGDMQVRGFASGVVGLPVGSDSLRNDYLGGYATWRSDGYYIDSVLQFGRHRYDVRPFSTLSAKGGAQSTLTSVELGKSFDLGSGWKLEPQLQLVGQRIEFDDIDIVGAHVSQHTGTAVTLRAGVLLSGDLSTSAGRLRPYGRINVYKTGGGTDYTVLAGPGASTAIATEKGGTSSEIASGFTFAVSPSTTLYGELGRRWAIGGAARIGSTLQASVGAQWRW